FEMGSVAAVVPCPDPTLSSPEGLANMAEVTSPPEPAEKRLTGTAALFAWAGRASADGPWLPEWLAVPLPGQRPPLSTLDYISPRRLRRARERQRLRRQ